MTVKRRVWTFFYGSFMNPLVPSAQRSVYGILAKVTHADLDKLYAKDWFGFGAYLPEAVAVSDSQRRRVPALCYIAWKKREGKPTQEYLQKMLSAAVKHRFPRSYIERLRSFGR